MRVLHLSAARRCPCAVLLGLGALLSGCAPDTLPSKAPGAVQGVLENAHPSADLSLSTGVRTANPPLPPSRSPVFQEDAVLALRMAAPFARLNAERQPPPEHPGMQVEQPRYEGRLSVVSSDPHAKVMDIHVRARGNQSLYRMDFAKLKVGIRGNQEEGTIFEHTDSFKIGTHGNDLPVADKGIPNELWTHREAFVYRILEGLGVPSLKSRPASITYEDTETNASFTRLAMLLEDPDHAARRFGGDEIEEPPAPEQTLIGTTPAFEAARIHLANALLGNWDYRLPETRFPLGHNLVPVRLADGGVLLLMEDFNLASIVRGGAGISSWLPEVFPDRSPQFKGVLQKILELELSMLGEPAFWATAEALSGRIPEVLEQLERAPLDEEGRSIIAAHLHGFVEAVTVGRTLPQLPEGAKVFVDAEGMQPIERHLRGQPVEILESRGEMSRVKLLYADHGSPPLREAWVKSAELVARARSSE